MFDAVLKFDPVYWRDFVPSDYITINADGVMQTKEQILADSARKDLFSGVSYFRHFGNARPLAARLGDSANLEPTA